MATYEVPIWLTAPDATGNAYLALLANTNRQHVFAFVKDVDGVWYGRVRVPQNYVSTPILVLSVGANATSGITRFTLGTAKATNAATWNVTAFTDETAQDITVPTTAYVRKDVLFPSTGNLATTIAANDDLFVRVYHNGIHANDTLAVDTFVFNLSLRYSDT